MIKKLKMKSFKSFGEKIRFHSECIAKKMWMMHPIAEEDVLKNIETLESLLRVAKCPDASCKDGIAIIIESGMTSGMQSDENGEPVEVPYLEEIPHQVQCQWCAEREHMIDKFEIHA